MIVTKCLEIFLLFELIGYSPSLELCQTYQGSLISQPVLNDYIYWIRVHITATSRKILL